jgi:predicted transcriptional regulator/transcriptional regulator with XRE-family HTH domain
MLQPMIGSKIRDRRRALGVAQRALAQRVGISASYLNLIESNRRGIAGGLLKRIAEELNASVDEFDGAAERHLVADLVELGAASVIGSPGLDASSATDLVAGHPEWARALVALHRAYRDRDQAVMALSDRLNQDPFLGEAVHSLLSKVAAISSVCEILGSEATLGPEQRERFLRIVGEDSRQLGHVASALAHFFDKAHTSMRSAAPNEEVDDFVAEHDAHFPRLEKVADELRGAFAVGAQGLEAALVDFLKRAHGVEVRRVRLDDAKPSDPALAFDEAQRILMLPDTTPGSMRRFELARLACTLGSSDAIDGELSRATSLTSAASTTLVRRLLQAYVAGAVLLPYDEFLAAATAWRYDIDRLGQRFGASFEQVCHRLVTLRRPGAEGIRFGFVRADPAGHITKRFPLPDLPWPRFGACPLWAVYAAFREPGMQQRQLVEFPNGTRYFFFARAIEKWRCAFGEPQRFVSVMLACNALHADRLVYADGLNLASGAPAVPVGPHCRLCVRRHCASRQEAPIVHVEPGLDRPQALAHRHRNEG